VAHIIAHKYEVIDQIGRGGMGVVYKVRHLTLETVLALKVLQADFVGDPEMVRRFYQEARLMARLHHPHIVQVSDVDRDGDTLYFVMEYIDGTSLSQRLRQQGPLSVPEALKVARQVAVALDYAHTHKPPVVHRDIKPDNILLEKSSGRAVVTDFGIAKVLGAGVQTRTDMIQGTLLYCAPEQILHSEDLDGRADLYSLGLVIHEMVTGRPFFAGLDARALLGRVLYGPEENVPTFVEPVPSDFATLVTRAIAREREHRYQRAADLVRDIDTCLARQTARTPYLQPIKSDGSPPGVTRPSSAQRFKQDEILMPTEWQRLLEPKTIQINSPNRIPSSLLRPFVDQEKKILCILPDQQVLPAVLTAVRENHLLVSVENRAALKLLRQQGTLVVVLFPIHPQQRYVLQTELQKIYPAQLCLQYKDPRYDVRYSVTRADPVTVQGLSAAAVTELCAGSLEMRRQTTWVSEGRSAWKIVRLEDGLRWKGNEEWCEATDYVDDTRTVTASLKDLSLGGMGLRLESEFLQEQWEKRIVLISVRLPRAVDEAVAEENYEIEVLATVRGVQYLAPHTFVYLRFVHRLPECLDLPKLCIETR